MLTKIYLSVKGRGQVFTEKLRNELDVKMAETFEICNILANIPNPKNTGRGAIPTFFGYHHIQLCGVSLSTAWGVRKADTSI
jgi:hypothetical protein